MPDQNQQRGVLYIVATPIGNLEDFSPRGVRILKEVDLVLAEDTRSFQKLASKFGIGTPVRSYHDRNERGTAPRLLEELQLGRSCALVSDAGTPGISDPGYHLVRACREANVPVVAVPGPSAVAAALSICGFEIHRFTFEGFLPQTKSKRRNTLLEALAREGATVFYESPHRIVQFLELCDAIDPDCELFVGRELTKLYEQTLSGTPKGVLSQLSKPARGEFVVIIRGKTRKPKEDNLQER